jgi:hypothetical protein
MAWAISLLVLFFVAIAIAFIAYEDKGKLQAQLEDAQAKAAAADARVTPLSQTISDISKSVGWYDPAAAQPETNTDAVAASLEDLRNTFPDLGAEVKTVEAALPVVAQAYQARGREIATLKGSVDSVSNEKATIEASLRQAASDKDDENTGLQRQLDDQTQSSATVQSGLERTNAQLRQQVQDLDTEKRQLQAAVDAAKRAHQDEVALLQSRLAEQGRKLAFLDEPAAADGSVLAVSDGTGLGWIDIGAQQRLARGTRFRVVSGKTGSEKVKAWAEVTRVDPSRAEVMFYNVADTFDPVVPGDIIFNPVYDPKGERNAVLAGNFSVPNATELRGLLEAMGVHVQSGLDLTTDYLIVGGPLYVDEAGESYEEPVEPGDLPIYKDAEAWGVHITPLKDLRAYFKF